MKEILTAWHWDGSVSEPVPYGEGHINQTYAITVRLDLCAAFKKRIVFCLTYGAAAEEAVHIKDNTLVNAVAGGSAVNGPG